MKKQKEDLTVELSCTKKELQQTKENMANQKKDASNVLSAVKTKHAKLELDIQTVEAAKRELQKDKEYWCSKEMELKEKLQQEWTKADKETTTSNVTMEKQFIHLQDHYDEQQKRIEQLQTELSTAQDHSETQQIVLKEENHMLQNRVENLTKQKDDVSLKLSDAKKELLQLKLELKEKLASVQQQWTKAEREVASSKLAVEKQFIRVQAQYDEQQKTVENLETELAIAQEEMKLRDITIGELNERIKETKTAANIQLQKHQISLKEKDECIQSLQLKEQELNEESKKKNEELLIRKAEIDRTCNEFDRITKELQKKEEENLKLAICVANTKEQTEKIWKEDF